MAKIVKLVCENCKTSFEVRKGKEKKTCSKICQLDLRKKNDKKFYIDKKCKVCGLLFRSKKKENKNFCSYICSGISKKIKSSEKRNCVNCNIEFTERKKYNRKLCSKKCRNEWNNKPENKKNRITKSKNALIKKYGVDSIFKTDKHKNNLSKLLKGRVNNTKALEKLKELRNNKIIERFNQLGYSIININGDNIKIKHPDGHIFENNRKLLINRLNHNVELSTEILPISAPKSTLELFISKILNKNNIKHITNDRNILGNKEIDILIPNHKLGIELNGLYWHSEYFLNKNYHLDKLNECNSKNYNLIQFFEDEIIEKPLIVESMINNKLGLNNNKVYGRKCLIKEIKDNNIIRDFLEKNHIQGFVGSKVKIGLYYNDELVSLMTFGKKRKFMNSKSKTNNEYELIRFCNKLNTSVVGGASKLYSFFIKNFNPDEIITYADKRYSIGDLYYKLGMEYVGESGPNYFYVVNKMRKNRFNYRKNILIENGYDKNLSEHEIMLSRNIPRIYDCGCYKFKYKKTP